MSPLERLYAISTRKINGNKPTIYYKLISVNLRKYNLPIFHTIYTMDSTLPRQSCQIWFLFILKVELKFTYQPLFESSITSLPIIP